MENQKYFGVMLDMSRNAVMKPEQVKKFVNIIHSFGYNMMQLYIAKTRKTQKTKAKTCNTRERV